MHPVRRSIAAAPVLAFALLAACSDATPPEAGTEPAVPAPEVETPMAEAAARSGVDPVFETADAFIDAFYSFDGDRLGAIMSSAPETAPRLLAYQASAFGGNYEVLDRVPCFWDEVGDVVCPVTVKDDRVQALRTGFDVTDVFHLTFEGGELVKVTTSSNDQDVYRQAGRWVRENMPEIMEGPCANRGTPEATPVECSRAMTAGYEAFAASPDFPGVPTLPRDRQDY